MTSRTQEEREGVPLTNLDQPLFPGSGAAKRDLVDYLDQISDQIIAELRDRPLSVIRVTRGQAPFMQKNLPASTPEWVARAPVWAEASHRTVSYALCNDRPTLLWFANQRAIEYHPTLTRIDRPEQMTHLVLDLDPPDSGASAAGSRGAFAAAVRAAQLVHQALDELGLAAAVKTSGAKGVHVFVPIEVGTTLEDAAAATRAIARRAEACDTSIATTAFVKADRQGKVFIDSTRTGGGTVVAAYSPRARAGVPVSFPVAWDDLESVSPADFTIHHAAALLDGRNPWLETMPPPQALPADLVAEGHEIPVPRVSAMHEGKRRARAQRQDQAEG
jgi:bifunctional non-homologous end joining protein LigD